MYFGSRRANISGVKREFADVADVSSTNSEYLRHNNNLNQKLHSYGMSVIGRLGHGRHMLKSVFLCDNYSIACSRVFVSLNKFSQSYAWQENATKQLELSENKMYEMT